ncbi:MAG: ABC transporter ATP-binding protein [Desulfurococcus sp.]|nr:ABC transporter ATP-binding protein [Desulfurococcus sp.]
MRGNWILKLESVRGGYQVGSSEKDYIDAVSNVSLEVYNEEVLGIVGESGSGKSTLVKIIYGDLTPPLVVKSGKVVLDASENPVDMISLKPAERRKLWWKTISYIPQQSMSVLNPTMRIRDHFIETLKYHAGMEKNEAVKLISKHVEEVGLTRDVLNAYPHQLSGGMRQRIIIALALMLKPKVIIADEPTTGLDVIVQRGVLQSLLENVRKYKSTLIIVSHDIGVISMITDRIAVMYAGKIVEVGKTERILQKPLHPYTKALIESIPLIGDRTPRKGLPGLPPNLKSPPPGCRFHPRCPLARDICRREEPPLVEVEPGHYVKCWLYSEGRK